MTVFLFDVLLSFLIFLRLISVFGFQGTTLTDISVIQAFCPDYGQCKCLSGDGEIRTLDPLLARQVLSQLSYAPMLVKVSSLACLFFSFISLFY